MREITSLSILKENIEVRKMSKKKFDGEEVRWGVLGAGKVCEVKSSPAMNKIENSKLIAVMRRNGDKARDYAERHTIPKWYDNADELIQDPGVNVVYIATPPNAHAELTKRVAAAGKPVYVEKPMARTYAECLEMIESCEKAGVQLYIAYYRRALPNYLKIKELIENGIIGTVRSIQIQMYKPVDLNMPDLPGNNWRVDPAIAGGGYFYDLASHQLDFLDFLFGPVVDVKGFAANQAGLYKAEDIVTGSFRFKSDVLGSGSWCFTSGRSSDLDRTTILGSNGEITYQTFGDPAVNVTTDAGGTERYDFTMPEHVQQPLIELVVQDLLGKGECPSTGISGARTNWVMEKMVQGGD